MGLFKSLGKLVSGAVKSVVNVGKSVVKTAGKIAGSVLKNPIPALMTVATGGASSLLGVATGSGVIGKVFGGLGSRVQQVVGGIVDKVESAANTVRTFSQTVIGNAGQALENAEEAIHETVSRGLEATKEALDKALGREPKAPTGPGLSPLMLAGVALVGLSLLKK